MDSDLEDSESETGFVAASEVKPTKVSKMDKAVWNLTNFWLQDIDPSIYSTYRRRKKDWHPSANGNTSIAFFRQLNTKFKTMFCGSWYIPKNLKPNHPGNQFHNSTLCLTPWILRTSWQWMKS